MRFAAPEFTSLCPVTGQPDFAHLVIDYAPGETIVECKSLKLYLGSFRNHCGFHEDVTVGIGHTHTAPSRGRPVTLERVDGVAGVVAVRAVRPEHRVVHLPQPALEEAHGLPA